MADSSSVDVNIITNAVDASGSTVISAVQSNNVQSSVATATVVTGGVGANGVGVPTGGTTGQVLAKSSNTDYATAWVAQSGGGGTPGGSTTQVQFNNAGVFAGDSMFAWDNTNKALVLGTGSPFNSTVNLQVGGSANTTIQSNVQNTNSGTSASSDWVATADTGSDTTNYIDMGINSSTYSDAAYTCSAALDGYLYNNGGNMVIGTQTATKTIKFHTGGTLAANLRATISDTGLSLVTPLALASGGTGSATQNFVDLTTTQTVGGVKTFSSANAYGTPASITLTNASGTAASLTAGNATKLATARTIAGTSFDGSANVTLANKFIVQGTTDAGLTGAQFLGALGTGLLKNTTTTGVLSTAVANTDYQAPITLTTTGTSGAATLISNTLNIPQYSAGGGGNTTNITTNTTKIDQAGGGTTTYGALAGLVNGSNTVYTVSNGAYVTGSLSVMLNGQDQALSSTGDYVETAPGSGTFTFAIAPPTGSIIIAQYITSATSTGNIYNPISTKTTAYTISGATDSYIRADATSGAFNVTLPTASSFTGFEYIIKKTDVSANAVTVVGTIDGVTNYLLSTQYKYLRVRSNGTNWDNVGNN